MRLRYFLIVSVVEIAVTMACKKHRSNVNMARDFSATPNVGYLNEEDTAAIVDENVDDDDGDGDDNDEDDDDDDDNDDDDDDDDGQDGIDTDLHDI